MILNLERFQLQARPRWKNLESLLGALESRLDRRLNPGEAEQLQELYAQVAADLNRVTHGALAPELRQYLERLVARAYAELYYAPPTRSETRPTEERAAMIDRSCGLEKSYRMHEA